MRIIRFCLQIVLSVTLVNVGTPVTAAYSSTKSKLAALGCSLALSGFVFAPDQNSLNESASPAQVFTAQFGSDISGFFSGATSTTTILMGTLMNGVQSIPVNWVKVTDSYKGQNGVIIWLSDAQKTASQFFNYIGQWTFHSTARFVIDGIHNQILNDLKAGNAALILFSSEQASERGQAMNVLSATSARALSITLALGGLMFVGGNFRFTLKKSETGNVSIKEVSNPNLHEIRANVRLDKTIRRASTRADGSSRDLWGQVSIGGEVQNFLAQVRVVAATIELSGTKLKLYQPDNASVSSPLKLGPEAYYVLSNDRIAAVESSLLRLTQFLQLIEKSFQLELKIRDSLKLLWHVHGDQFQGPFLEGNSSQLGNEVGHHLATLVEFIRAGGHKMEPLASLSLMINSQLGQQADFRANGEAQFEPQKALSDFIAAVTHYLPSSAHHRTTGAKDPKYQDYENWSRGFVESMMKALKASGVEVGTYKEGGIVSFSKSQEVLKEL